MKQVTKITLLILFVIGLCVANSDVYADDSFTEDVNATVYQCDQSYSFGNIKHKITSDVELGGIGVHWNGIGNSSAQNTQSRTSVSSLHDVVKVLVQYETALFKHSIKSCDTSFLSSVIHPVGKYYVFALRHIII